MADENTSIKRLQIILGVVILALVALRLGTMKRSSTGAASMPADYGSVGDFTFVDQSGKPYGLTDLKGKVWVADFFFTQCMGPCPMLTTRMVELQKEMARQKDLVFLSFSVDPDHDTPEVLNKYAGTYNADLVNWHFLTGPKEKIYKLVRENFHLAVEQKPPEKPSINDILHSLYFVLVDRDGHVRGYFNSADQDALKNLKDQIRSL